MSSLYQIDSDILELVEHGFTVDCGDMETGEIDVAKVQEYLTALPIEREKKIEAYGCIIKNLTAEAEAIREEEKALAARRQRKEKKIEWLKENVATSMTLFGEKKHETARVAFSFRKSEVVEADIDRLPPQYITEKITKSPDKTAIKTALKSGEVIEGASLIVKQNLQIK